MKKNSPFTLQKVSRYSKAKYASESPKSLIRHALWLAWSFPNKIIKGAVTALLIVGLAAGLQACQDDVTIDGDSVLDDGDYAIVDGDYTVADGDKDVNYVDGDGIDFGDDDSCVRGDDYCVNNNRVAQCTETGYFQQIDCDEFCREEHGSDYNSQGCYEGKCECDYAIADGDYVDCEPSDSFCTENNGNDYFHKCYGGDFQTTKCHDLCAETFGENYSSYGCDATDNTNPCHCLDDYAWCGDQDDDADACEQDKTETDGDLDAVDADKIDADQIDLDEIDRIDNEEYDSLEGEYSSGLGITNKLKPSGGK